MVLATTRADVNGFVRRRLDVRSVSFAPWTEAVALTRACECDGIHAHRASVRLAVLVRCQPSRLRRRWSSAGECAAASCSCWSRVLSLAAGAGTGRKGSAAPQPEASASRPTPDGFASAAGDRAPRGGVGRVRMGDTGHSARVARGTPWPRPIRARRPPRRWIEPLPPRRLRARRCCVPPLWVAIGALIAAAVVCVLWVLPGLSERYPRPGVPDDPAAEVSFVGVAILDAHLAPTRPAWFALASMASWIVRRCFSSARHHDLDAGALSVAGILAEFIQFLLVGADPAAGAAAPASSLRPLATMATPFTRTDRGRVTISLVVRWPRC